MAAAHPTNLRALSTPPVMHRILPLLLVLATTPVLAQNADVRFAPVSVGFFNIENLYDTIDSPDTDDHEFLPSGPKQWGSARYFRKVEKMAQVISELGADIHPDGLACIGLSEIENRSVLEDLVKAPALKARNLGIVHVDGPDRRGVDCAFLYHPGHFTVLGHRSYRLSDPADTNFRSRDQLLVSGILDGDTTHFIVAHWPSRRGGEKRSQPKRFLAGTLGRHITDSLLARNADARVIYMGDLNDDPVDPSVKRFLGSSSVKEEAVNGKFFNPMGDLYRKGIGSLAWNDSWNLFDQILLSPAIVTGAQGGARYYATRIFNKPYLRQSEGNFAGYPFRTFVGDQYMDGYSDHFPVFVTLVKEVE